MAGRPLPWRKAVGSAARCEALKLVLRIPPSAWRWFHDVNVLLQPLRVLGIQGVPFRAPEIEFVAAQQHRHLVQVLLVGVPVAGALLQGARFESRLEHHLVLQNLTRFNFVPKNGKVLLFVEHPDAWQRRCHALADHLERVLRAEQAGGFLALGRLAGASEEQTLETKPRIQHVANKLRHEKVDGAVSVERTQRGFQQRSHVRHEAVRLTRGVLLQMPVNATEQLLRALAPAVQDQVLGHTGLELALRPHVRDHLLRDGDVLHQVGR